MRHLIFPGQTWVFNYKIMNFTKYEILREFKMDHDSRKIRMHRLEVRLTCIKNVEQ